MRARATNPPADQSAEKLMANLGYSKGYQHAHDFEHGLTDQDCLPPGLKGRVYYQPAESGYEKTIRERMAQFAELRKQIGARRKKSLTLPYPRPARDARRYPPSETPRTGTTRFATWYQRGSCGESGIIAWPTIDATPSRNESPASAKA